MEITQELTKSLAKLVAKEIDLDKMAKKLAPVIAKEVERNTLKAFKNIKWDEWIEDVFSDSRVWSAYKRHTVTHLLDILSNAE